MWKKLLDTAVQLHGGSIAPVQKKKKRKKPTKYLFLHFSLFWLCLQGGNIPRETGENLFDVRI